MERQQGTLTTLFGYFVEEVGESGFVTKFLKQRDS